jgi:hypothetical protein
VRHADACSAQIKSTQIHLVEQADTTQRFHPTDETIQPRDAAWLRAPVPNCAFWQTDCNRIHTGCARARVFRVCIHPDHEQE